MVSIIIKTFFLVTIFEVVRATQWLKIEEAIKTAKEEKKLVLFYMHKEACKPCKKLSDSLESSKEFVELSSKFVLASAVDTELPKDKKYDLDGKYVPKIIFLNNGVVLSDIVNEDAKSNKAKYFYKKAEHVVKSMNKALEKGELHNGFGTDYVWYDWESGLKASKEHSKPILAIFHQDWCSACQRLKPKFAESDEIKQLAGEFIMINTDSEEVVKAEKYKADGEYYPKVIFLDEEGEHYKGEWNHGTKHPHVLHYYDSGVEIAASMSRILANRSELNKIEDNGFGKHLRFVKYEDGKKMAKEQGKPMMLIIHKSYCGACQALKPKVRSDPEIAELSTHFIMVNCNDDEEPNEDQFDLDGAYIPRIFFLDNLGKVEPSIFNDDKEYIKAKYAYGSTAGIIKSMRRALEMNLGKREQPGKKGFGTNINWMGYEEGLIQAKKMHKAIMLVMYNDYCEFSSFMMKQFRESNEIAEVAKKFVMVNVGEEEGKALGEKFDVDGTYTPRIFFMDPDQNLRTDINNTDSPYKLTLFYYGKTEDILNAMNLALEKINLTLGRGFGEYIEWKRFENALEHSKESKMPIMLIIHKSWCGACSALKPKIANSRPIWKLSYYFNMVNVEDEEEPLDNQFFIDGGYYPRIFFLDYTGKVHHDLHNRDPAFLKYKFSYQEEEQIINSMRFAIAKLSTYALPTEDQKVITEGSSIDTTNLTMGKRILVEGGLTSVTIDEALEMTKKTKKPIMFIIHRTTCPSCKAVLKMITRDEEFKGKLEHFILADIEDDIDDVKADSYDVDGGYVPRIYFLDPQGKIFKDIWNLGTNYMDNKFYYYEMISINRAMDKTLKKMETWEPSLEEAGSQATKNQDEKKDEL
ncbi:uncharacterized protein LOC100207796 isoform X3 [Hydra vulgaris]|uniref:Uncharacterized protein LOC100207796 isoform X3 n=1 Tax=Hydra vulgaris TaxID=6087 RepID=A0ABM4BLJ1_HYDVU